MISRNTFPVPQPDSASYVTKLIKTTQHYPVPCTCPEYSVVYRGGRAVNKRLFTDNIALIVTKHSTLPK